MQMHEERASPRSAPIRGYLNGLGPAVLCAWFILAVSAIRFVTELPYISGQSRDFNLLDELAASPALQWAVSHYALSTFALYTALGLVGWLLASATAYAMRWTPDRNGSRRSVATVLLLYGCAHFINAAWYPNSIFAAHLPEEVRLGFAPGTWATPAFLAATLVALWTVCAGAGSILRMAQNGWHFRVPKLTLGLIGAALVISVPVLPNLNFAVAESHENNAPNVIFIGIDSLRTDVTMLGTKGSLTPNVDSFLSNAHVFADSITPLARTFPSWVTLLTGRHPVATNARVNLTARERILEGETLSEVLMKAGYQTVMATDEVRFSNIDETFGFDEVIAPPAGIADFVVGAMSDFPLVNLVSNTRIAAWLFPHIYANRAAFKTYTPDSFVRRLDAELSPQGPTFVAIHLTLPHYPYAWRDLPYDSSISSFRRQYPAAVRAADEQFAKVLDILRNKRLLDNAIVVVLSDHGEAVGDGEETTLPRTDEFDSEWWRSIWGHGTSVLNPHQYQVLLALRGFGNEIVSSERHTYSEPVSIEDVSPTIVDLLGLPSPASADGISLASLLRKSSDTSRLIASRVRFTESEFTPVNLSAAKIDETELVADVRSMYEIRTDNGRVQLREDARQRIIRSKELLATREGKRLAALPTESGKHTYLWFEDAESDPMYLGTEPDLTNLPEAAALLRALKERFPGEV